MYKQTMENIRIVIIIFQNTEKISKRKTPSKNIFFELNSNQVSLCYFCKVYKVTVSKQLEILYLITIYKKYFNSKKVLCIHTL